MSNSRPELTRRLCIKRVYNKQNMSSTVIRELLLMSAWVLNQLGLINVVSFTSHSLEGNKSLFKINNT
jgi:hypothetical protein